MGKAKRFNSYDNDVEQQRKLVKSYGLARQSNSVSAFRSMPQSAPTATNTDNEAVVATVGTGAITATQLASNAVTTVKILDSNVTFDKIQDIATMKVIGRTSAGSGVSSEISILDEDTMSSNSDTALATQQSIKAYVLANSSSGVELSDSNTWTSSNIFDTTTTYSGTVPVKFQGDGNNTTQTVMEIGKYGAHGVKFISEILGDSGRTMTNPDGGSDINVPGSNEPALSIKSAMIMNTYTMYDLDSLVFSQGASSTTPPPENDWVYIEANTGTSGSPSLTGMTYNVPTSKTHQFKVNGALKVSIDDDIDFEANSTLEIANTIALPSSLSASGGAMAPPTNPTAYFKVHYNGADRYIPYYT